MSSASQKEYSNILKTIDCAVESDKFMTPQKFKAIFNGLSTNTKKVYESTPITTPWCSGKILGELKRIGISMTKQTVEANLNILVKNNLIEEHDKGYFTRSPIKKDGEVVSIKKTVKETYIDGVKPEITPIDRMVALSESVHILAKSLQEIQEQVETITIQIQDDFERANQSGAKLKQLQELLKGLT